MLLSKVPQLQCISTHNRVPQPYSRDVSPTTCVLDPSSITRIIAPPFRAPILPLHHLLHLTTTTASILSIDSAYTQSIHCIPEAHTYVHATQPCELLAGFYTFLYLAFVCSSVLLWWDEAAAYIQHACIGLAGWGRCVVARRVRLQTAERSGGSGSDMGWRGGSVVIGCWFRFTILLFY